MLKNNSFFSILVFAYILLPSTGDAMLLVPMDIAQPNHLKAYGAVYHTLKEGDQARWLLNYRGGSFIVPDTAAQRSRLMLLGVLAEPCSAAEYDAIRKEIEASNMSDLLLEHAPRLAVYAPDAHDPWDDAVTLVLEYAGIPYTRIYDREVLAGRLQDFDWLHIHHEDFSGQYGKFHRFYHNVPWYVQQRLRFQKMAQEAGHASVAAYKLAVAETIREYVEAGGFLFAMCSAAETIDIALAAAGMNIVPPEIGGHPLSPDVQSRLDYSRTFAFTGFILELDANVYAHSDIDIDVAASGLEHRPDSFDLFSFASKIDPVPSMLVQNHVHTVKGFLGQTTAFRRERIKPGITILGHTSDTERVKYIYGNLGLGTFAFYGGHDPEDYRHLVGDPPTNLDLYPQSPGYRLILNNVLFPVAEKQERKT